MKKIIILFAAFSLTMTLAHAQRGYGRNDGARQYRGGNTTYSGTVVTHQRSYGYNQRVVTNGYRNRSCAPQPRVRWEWSPCGTYRWRIVEQAYWIPPRMVYNNGCRRRVEGYYDWRCSSRTKVFASNRGRRGRGW